MTVTDNGRGIPVDIHPKTKRPAIETILCTLHAGGKFDHTAYKSSGGLHGVGASVVNALSEVFIATVWRDGYEWTQEFSRGKPKGNLKKGKPTKAHGTQIYFRPDPEIFSKTSFNYKNILDVSESKAFLNKGLKITIENAARRGEAGHVQVRQRHPGLHQAHRLRHHGREPRAVLFRERRRLQDRVRDPLDPCHGHGDPLLRELDQHLRRRHPRAGGQGRAHQGGPRLRRAQEPHPQEHQDHRARGRV